MLPIDSTTGKFWSHEAATAKIAEIRAGINDDLRQRDAGHGIAADGIVYDDSLDGDPDADKKHGQFIVDQAKSRVRSTGHDHVALLKSRWAQFCENPQDEAGFIEKHRASDRAKNRDRAVSDAVSIEDSLKPAKRGPGRPRGGRNKAPEPPAPESVSVETTATAEAATAEG